MLMNNSFRVINNYITYCARRTKRRIQLFIVKVLRQSVARPSSLFRARAYTLIRPEHKITLSRNIINVSLSVAGLLTYRDFSPLLIIRSISYYRKCTRNTVSE